MDIDLLRLLTAFVVGAVLSFAGSLVQITTRNDLASPSTLGMDGVAVLMVMLSFLLQSLGLNFSLTHMALGLGVITLIVLSFFSSVFLKQRDLKIVVLMGMSVNLLVGAVFSIMQFMAMAFNQKFPDQLWFGRILSLDASSGLGLAVLLVAVFGFMLRYRSSWKALLLGRGWCHGLGIPVEKMIKISLMLSFLITLWVVVHFGVFGFLGLLYPLVLRQSKRYRGEPWKEMTDGAALAGLTFAILDQICFQITFHGAEIPVGLPASLLGACALVVILWRRNLTR